MRSVGCGSWSVWSGISGTYVIPLAVRLQGDTRPHGAGGGAGRSGRAAREPAHGVPGPARGAAARDPVAAVGAARLEIGSVDEAEPPGGADDCGRAWLRSVPRDPAAGASVRDCGCPTWRCRARSADRAAPHRGRRLVARVRWRETWRRCTGRAARASRATVAAAGAVRRLHAVAAGGAGRRE